MRYVHPPRNLGARSSELRVVAETMLIAPFNDLDRAAELITRHRDELAGVIVEPLQGSGAARS